MQMIKNEKGVTIVALIITIIVTIMLAGITINTGLDSIHSTRDRNLQAELEIVGQAAITEYTKAVELGYIGSGVPANFIGEKLSSPPMRPSNQPWAIPTGADNEKAYFRLTPENLEKLEIKNSNYTYIINYYTGEVYNETKQKSSKGLDLYIKMDNANHISNPTDTSSFTGQ